MSFNKSSLLSPPREIIYGKEDSSIYPQSALKQLGLGDGLPIRSISVFHTPHDIIIFEKERALKKLKCVHDPLCYTYGAMRGRSVIVPVDGYPFNAKLSKPDFIRFLFGEIGAYTSAFIDECSVGLGVFSHPLYDGYDNTQRKWIFKLYRKGILFSVWGVGSMWCVPMILLLRLYEMVHSFSKSLGIVKRNSPVTALLDKVINPVFRVLVNGERANYHNMTEEELKFVYGFTTADAYLLKHGRFGRRGSPQRERREKQEMLPYIDSEDRITFKVVKKYSKRRTSLPIVSARRHIVRDIPQLLNKSAQRELVFVWENSDVVSVITDAAGVVTITDFEFRDGKIFSSDEVEYELDDDILKVKGPRLLYPVDPEKHSFVIT